ncbi:hypothetical protein NL676_028462 [Syzygium grande]|nr:hypothetical protein NL676_028462 [Syzygium grande]
MNDSFTNGALATICANFLTSTKYPADGLLNISLVIIVVISITVKQAADSAATSKLEGQLRSLSSGGP